MDLPYMTIARQMILTVRRLAVLNLLRKIRRRVFGVTLLLFINFS